MINKNSNIRNEFYYFQQKRSYCKEITDVLKPESLVYINNALPQQLPRRKTRQNNPVEWQSLNDDLIAKESIHKYNELIDNQNNEILQTDS